jgi:membrane protein
VKSVAEQPQPAFPKGPPQQAGKRKFQLPHHRINAHVRQLMEAEEDSLTRSTRALVYFLKLVRETWREIQEKNCTLRASALAYKSLVSLVPLAAIMLALLSMPALESKREEVMNKALDSFLPLPAGVAVPEEGAAGQPPVDESAESKAVRELARTRQNMKEFFTSNIHALAKRAAAVNSLGFLALFLIVLSLMYTVEETFNRIWGVPRGRPILSRVTSYTAALVWGSILLVASLSLSAIFRVESGRLGDALRHLAWFRQVIAFCMPMVISTAAFTALYCILPNTRVRLKPALGGAALAAVLWELAKVAFNLYVKYVVAKNQVYGTLGLIPVTFLWLYYTWLVVLFGASVSFTIQNYEDLTRKDERRRRGVRFRVYYAIRTAAAVAARFSRAEKTVVVDELAERLDIPEYAVRESLETLADKGILVSVAGELDAFVPARPLEKITVADILEAVSGETFHMPAVAADPTHERLQKLIGTVEGEIHGRLGALSLRDLAADEQASRAKWLESHGAAPA